MYNIYQDNVSVVSHLKICINFVYTSAMTELLTIITMTTESPVITSPDLTLTNGVISYSWTGSANNRPVGTVATHIAVAMAIPLVGAAL